MNQKKKKRFSKFENVKHFYHFYLRTINWLCENFSMKKIF